MKNYLLTQLIIGVIAGFVYSWASFYFLGKTPLDALFLYCLFLFLFGTIWGFFSPKLSLLVYLGLVAGQAIYILFLSPPTAFISLSFLFTFLYSLLFLFGNAIGGTVSRKNSNAPP
jgi:hypothetical protein